MPEFISRNEKEVDKESSKQDELMWTCDVLECIDESQLTAYLDLLCKSSVVFGSSNNLELGLHILSYFKGNVKLALKAFLDDTIDLPVDHPITTYKYSG